MYDRKIEYPIGSCIEDFEIVSQIGKGGFATVYKAKCLNPGFDDVCVAIKKMCKKFIEQNKLQRRIEDEIRIHSQLDHYAIVKLYTWFQDDDYVYLVMELCEGGSLKDIMKRKGPFSEDNARNIIEQVIDGVRYLNHKFIIHRDLSDKNVLLTDTDNVKIIDFGMAAQLKNPNEKKHTMCGTANFMAPEVVAGNSYGFKTDYWGIGCLLYTILVGKPPFDGKGHEEIFTNVSNSDIHFPESISNEAQELILKLLEKNSNSRADLKAALDHPFFRKSKSRLMNAHTKFYYRSGDSGMGSSTVSLTAGVKSGNRSYKTVDSGLGYLQAGIQEENYKIRRSASSEISRLETNQSPVCYYHSSRSLSKYGIEVNNCTTGLKKLRSESPSSALRDCKDKAGCVKLLKHKIPTLPSRKDNFCEITVSEKFPANCKRQEHSASEERRKFMHHNSHSARTNVHPISNRNSVTTIEHDCHEFQPPNLTSCSHDKHCYSESISCSHEKFCLCQKISSLPLKCKSESNNLQSNYCYREMDTPNSKTLNQLVDPLNSVRLKPKRILKKNTVISILDNGEVCLEFLKVKKDKKYVTQVFAISSDGMSIYLYKVKSGFLLSDKPPPKPRKLHQIQHFSHDNLPEIHWKKYLYASKFINFVRAQVPKITLYGKLAKCIMMENSPDPDYEMLFYDGEKIVKISDKFTITERSGRNYTFTSPEDLSKEYEHIWNEFVKMKEKCEILEKHLECLNNSSNWADQPLFPVVIGKRPTALTDLKNGKENDTPRSSRSFTLSGLTQNMISYDQTIDTDYSPYSNSSQKYVSKLQNTSSDKICGLQNIKEILAKLKESPKIKNDKVFVEYKDGVQMWSSKDGTNVEFFDFNKGWKCSSKEAKYNSELKKRIQNDLAEILCFMASKDSK
ncbi:serine/threonine-protein kinase PLK4-like isoform X2 [Stegodyphus dumicola]|uniref:serine/threonine-protein kinase PLK4-like isoform X2 n=1 Tax=Stegodyphus dumicola TaxID=202533 RepID=UPI0015A9F442|nr:serine/threonine-protein kinase PLK4-like isoform X2 [Stegodyphus dumicola]